MDDKLKRLMEVAEKPLKVPIKKIEYSSSVFQFIAEAKIRSSEKDLIPFATIYYRYCKWCKGNNLKPKNFNSFGADFQKKFSKAEGKAVTQYKISPEGFDLTPQYEQEAQEFLQDVRSGKKEKKSNRQPKANKSTQG